MSYRLAIHADPGVELKRVVAEQAEKALASLTNRPEGLHAAVHDMRKRAKKIRACFRLARPALGKAYKRENARYRDAAGELSALRDAAAMVEMADVLRDLPEEELDPDLLDRLEKGLAKRRDTAVKRLGNTVAAIDRARKALEKGVAALPDIALPADGFDTLEGGFRKSYSRARGGFAACREDPSDAEIHEWRKRTKYHWYHLRLLRDVWPDAIKARRDLTKHLADLLGDERDLMLLARTIEADGKLLPEPEAWELLSRIARARQRLRAEALTAGAKLMTEKPGALCRRVAACWNAEAAAA